ncbi:unnamed protein product [Caenorhabditis sp. 36 PRJEB53466]|nr:unnamed protein product [Caenorhabditis sp. 36 PRJEB53466]
MNISIWPPFRLLFFVGISAGFYNFTVDIDMKYNTPGIHTFCYFLEIFQSDPIYEQRLRKYDKCAETTADLSYPTFPNLNSFRPKLKPLRRYGIGDPYSFSLHIQLTHNATRNDEIRCVRDQAEWRTETMDRAVYFSGNLLNFKASNTSTDAPGACSARWIGSELWKAHSQGGHKKTETTDKIVNAEENDGKTTSSTKETTTRDEYNEVELIEMNYE